jgi:hypothetical protein
MDYRSNVQERKYGEVSEQRNYSVQTFSRMYEMAMRFSQGGSHIGDYSKEILEEPSKHYEGKVPKKQVDSSPNYKFLGKFSIN